MPHRLRDKRFSYCHANEWTVPSNMDVPVSDPIEHHGARTKATGSAATASDSAKSLSRLRWTSSRAGFAAIESGK